MEFEDLVLVIIVGLVCAINGCMAGSHNKEQKILQSGAIEYFIDSENEKRWRPACPE